MAKAFEVIAADLLPPRPELSPARTRLFATALVLFGERGYHGVSVRDITDRLGQKPGALYAHVRSKQDLLFELVMIGHAEHRDRLVDSLIDSGPEPVARITALVRAHVLVHLAYPALARVTNQEFRFLDEEQVAAALAIRSESELLIIDAVRQGVREGQFTVADPYLAMTAIGAMGIRTAEWWTPNSPRTPQHIADTYSQFAVSLLR